MRPLSAAIFDASFRDSLMPDSFNIIARTFSIIFSSYAAFLWLFSGHRSSTLTPRAEAMDCLVASLFTWPYSTCDVHVLERPIIRASFETSRSLSQNRFLIFLTMVLFFTFILNTCYYNLKINILQKESFVKRKIT